MTLDLSKISARIPGVLTQTLDYDELFFRLRAGHRLITANSRLTRVLTDQYNQWNIESGKQQWNSPDICSWNQWINQLWEKAGLLGVAGTDRAVPGSRQLINLWEKILNIKPLSADLIRPESLASQLRDTRQLLTEWQVNQNHPAWFGDTNENHTAFHQWNRAFDGLCEKADWINPGDRLSILCESAGALMGEMNAAIDLLGFDEFSPARRDLLAALHDKGLSLCILTVTPRRDKAVMWKSRDGKDEIDRMARWVRHCASENKDARIAVVVPELQACRQQIERALGEILTPGHQNDCQRAKPWNISMGISLARVPVIEAAFDLLKMMDENIDIQDIGRVLRSPWLRGSEAERNNRSLLEKCLREHYPRQLKLGELIFRAGEINKYDRYNQPLPIEEHTPQAWNSPLLLASFKTLARFRNDHHKVRPPSAWAESLNQLLMNAGWSPGKQDPEVMQEENAENWQALQKWHECLRELASLDATSPSIGRSAAIHQLQQICRENIFQAHTPPTRIQVLGLYEISGLRFDYLWVIGLHNDSWPTSAKPNPFIPGQLQREANLPNSSPERELEVARIITQRLLDTAPMCVFSYPGQVDGEAQLPSPLLAGQNIQAVDDIEAWMEKNWRETVAGAEGPKWDALEMPGQLTHGTARGGSSILKHQALCPFRAFASNRLGAEGMETPVDGISPALHGSLVHKVLELFWKETKTQANLLQLNDELLSARVQKHVEAVTSEERGLEQRPAFKEVEAQRVKRHVLNYLALETERDAFEVVGFEREILAKIEGQEVRLIIDRIDRLESGEEIIIDYKTGKVDPKKWFGERPDDPQLPLYAISAEKQPAAVAFGIVREDGCEFKGIVTREGLLPQLPPKESVYTIEQVEAGKNMPETIANWRQTLHRLMSEFLEGDAAIDPKTEMTCGNTYCQLQPLCRIRELQQHSKVKLQSDDYSDLPGGGS